MAADDHTRDLVAPENKYDVYEKDESLVKYLERFLEGMDDNYPTYTIPYNHAYLYGAGFEMSFANLWKYKTIHAQSVTSWIQDNAHAHKCYVHFSSQPYPEIIRNFALRTWFVAQFPLMFQQALVRCTVSTDVPTSPCSYGSSQ